MRVCVCVSACFCASNCVHVQGVPLVHCIGCNTSSVSRAHGFHNYMLFSAKLASGIVTNDLLSQKPEQPKLFVSPPYIPRTYFLITRLKACSFIILALKESFTYE